MNYIKRTIVRPSWLRCASTITVPSLQTISSYCLCNAPHHKYISL
ncbi:hypothetical protein MNB_SV-10-1192 [hydrothermal vent metagenome]|uniref:Uncharacterized protein n=1 Tax=hydrothermal vent metagenome TaxID=652676 RepID=A0A1W1BGY4_9ZZZZ